MKWSSPLPYGEGQAYSPEVVVGFVYHQTTNPKLFSSHYHNSAQASRDKRRQKCWYRKPRAVDWEEKHLNGAVAIIGLNALARYLITHNLPAVLGWQEEELSAFVWLFTVRVSLNILSKARARYSLTPLRTRSKNSEQPTKQTRTCYSVKFYHTQQRLY